MMIKFRDISKKEIFQLHKLPWPVESNKLLSLRQGRPVMTRRLQELDLSVSPSQPNTPKDGNCMMSSILDQLSFDPYQELCKESSAATNEDPRLWIWPVHPNWKACLVFWSWDWFSGAVEGENVWRWRVGRWDLPPHGRKRTFSGRHRHPGI